MKNFVLPSGNLILLTFDSLSALDCPQAPRMTLPLPVGLVQARERLLILHHSPPRDWTVSLNVSFRRCLYRCSWRRCVAKQENIFYKNYCFLFFSTMFDSSKILLFPAGLSFINQKSLSNIKFPKNKTAFCFSRRF